MSNEIRISTGIEALDRTVDYLRPGDTVTWQMASIGDFVFIATQFVTSVALTGRRIVYLRFGRHPEVVATEALARRGANIRQYDLDATVGFETFSVQVHRIISAESEDAFFILDCISDLQKFWFSDAMVCNFFCLTADFLRARKAIAYIPLRYERHTYETISRIRHATNVLLNIRSLEGRSYIHPVKVDGRHTDTMYFPLIVHEALMVEPTETETVETLDEAVAVFRRIMEQAKADPEHMHERPLTTRVRRPDEVKAARKPVVRYDFGS